MNSIARLKRLLEVNDEFSQYRKQRGSEGLKKASRSPVLPKKLPPSHLRSLNRIEDDPSGLVVSHSMRSRRSRMAHDFVHTVKTRSGREWTFLDRSIPGIGRNVTPLYPVRLGMKKGGRAEKVGDRYWWLDYRPDTESWERIRPLEPEEQAAFLFVLQQT